MAASVARERFGKLVAAIGTLLVGFVVVSTGVSVASRPEAKCDALPQKGGPVAGAMLWSPQDTLTVNGELCLWVNTSKYFNEELGQKDALETALTTANTALSQAQAALAALTEKPWTGTPAEQSTALTAAKAKVKEAELAQATAATKRAALGKDVTVAVFVDDKQMPITFPIIMNDPRPWTPTLLKLRVPEKADTDEARAWREMLSGGGVDGVRGVKLSLGDKDALLPRPGAVMMGMHVRSFYPGRVALGALGLVAMVGGLVAWGWGTGMLRDRAPTTDDPNPPFSLGRVQMAFWFLLSLGGFLAIWLITAQSIGVMTPGVLALVGISGATGVAAVAVDSLPAPAPQPGASPPPTSSRGFLTDILSDGRSVAFHRVQMLAWTVVLGTIFLWSVFWTFTFPLFDETLLILAGVVNSVYIGFKFPEKT